MNTRKAFQFISSYRGEADYEHRASGVRVRRYWGSNEINWISSTPEPEGLHTEWAEFLDGEQAEFLVWCEQRGFDPASASPKVAS